MPDSLTTSPGGCLELPVVGQAHIYRSHLLAGDQDSFPRDMSLDKGKKTSRQEELSKQLEEGKVSLS